MTDPLEEPPELRGASGGEPTERPHSPATRVVALVLAFALVAGAAAVLLSIIAGM